MLEISLVMGVLYIGLPPARYRKRLLDQVAGLIDQFDVKSDDEYRKNLAEDEVLLDNHRLVAMWIGELLQSDSAASIKPNSWARKFTSAGFSKKLTKSYRWFRIHGDKTLVVLMSCMFPIFSMWFLAISDLNSCLEQSRQASWLLYSVAGLGQLTPIAHVGIGYFFLQKSTYKKFRGAMEEISKWHELRETRESLSSFTH